MPPKPKSATSPWGTYDITGMARDVRLRLILNTYGPDTPLSPDDLAFVSKYVTGTKIRVAYNYKSGQRELLVDGNYVSPAKALAAKSKAC